MQYPAGWIVKDAEKQYSWGSDTTIVSPTDPNTLLRVDVSPNTTATDPVSAAAPVVKSVSHQPGYQQLDLSLGTLNGYQIEHWQFLLPGSGESLEKEDDFFIDSSNGDGVGILTQAPVSQYGGLVPEFAAMRQSLSIN